MISDYYTETVVLLTQSTSTGWGNEPGWSTSGTTVSAAVNPASGRETFAGMKETQMVSYKMYCSDTVTIDDSYRVQYAGDTFDVIFVKDTLNMGHHKTVYLSNYA